ncbi:MAG TPA: L-serine ammonia-lyase, iron-sulfur-dependent, subunit alpha [Anaerolineae bacterium]
MSLPSIFNDVIGPVMRGPSSSHCAAALRIGRLARDLMGGRPDSVLVEHDIHGSLATTHRSQGSDMGLAAGLLGWDATEARLPQAEQAAAESGIHIETRILDFGAEHPNTYRLTLRNPHAGHTLSAISTGGGIFQVTALDGVSLTMDGDTYETLIYLDRDPGPVVALLDESFAADAILVFERPDGYLVEVKGQSFLPAAVLAQLRTQGPLAALIPLAPVMPVLSRRDLAVPFTTCGELLRYDAGREQPLSELAIAYECRRGNLTREQVLAQMQAIARIMQASTREGLAGTTYADRILGPQAGQLQAAAQAGRLLDGGMLNQIIAYVTAMMEVKSALGVIVAAPTAGSCGVLPGCCLGAADYLGLPLEAVTEALLAAGQIGLFIASGATFAAEMGGCQVECGAGSGMAAAALVTLARGTLAQALAAASMALQNTLGLICDPVANRVEVPCLGKNVMAAANALACANLALAGYDPVIPLDEVVVTMKRVGLELPRSLRCTGLGGLSTTPTAQMIELRFRGEVIR